MKKNIKSLLTNPKLPQLEKSATQKIKGGDGGKEIAQANTSTEGA